MKKHKLIPKQRQTGCANYVHAIMDLTKEDVDVLLRELFDDIPKQLRTNVQLETESKYPIEVPDVI